MCRLLAYLGRPVVLDKFLFQPKNSLINQSFHALEIEEPLNGDGFGVGWYHKEIAEDPAVFVSIYPAWNNRNLRYMAPKIMSDCLVAHVRAASEGDVSESNCHPFHFKNFLMAHNGGVENFSRIKRSVHKKLSDPLFHWIQGQTDSEHLFALVLDNLMKKDRIDADTISQSFEETIAFLLEAMHEQKIDDPAYLNMVMTDGERLVALRYASDKTVKPLTLYYSEGSRYECQEGVCQMIPAREGEKSVMVVSEKLTDIVDDWRMIPENNFILVYKDLSVKIRPVSL
jgi:predicted glutamine amidotransferase